MLLNQSNILKYIGLLGFLSSSMIYAANMSSKDYSSLKSLSNSNIFSTLNNGHTVIQLGGYWSIQGKSQHIDIDTLIGDTFTLTDRHDSNGAVGLGYYVDGGSFKRFDMHYGINGFYLPKTSVSGNVIQENLFTNLSYNYHITHYPVYVVAKATAPLKSRYALMLDAGIGPNFMRANGFQEHSLDGGVTIPDNAFSGHTSTTFSATAGIGIKLDQAFGKAPLQCGYRFFYLGEGRLTSASDQILSTFKTGSAYGNALMCAISL